MDKAFFLELRTVFQHACTLGPEERKEYLGQACEGDSSLRKEVEALLAFDTEHDSIRGGVAAHVRGLAIRDQIPRPERIGSYEILGILGQGGMGLVYRARQEKPDREVALKVLRPGMISKRMLERFELETQALGRLRHPGIAQIYEAGTADVGSGSQPYFAMELVEGISFVEYAEHLELEAKLTLLVEVCRAVHHAHQRGVIHRDLKPENVLINAEGHAKILDFGVASLTDSDLRVTTLGTDVGSIIGTLPYMSPEQATGALDEIDARSDVYSLGVLVYEILGGRLPFNLSGQSIPQAVRTIAEQTHAPLSAIHHAFRGDLETIVSKALEKDPARRYASAAGLAGDIERHLANEPIVARPPSTIYQLKKLARRHRGLAVGVFASLAILVVAVIALSALTIRARHAEARATKKAEVTLAVNEFLERFLSTMNPYREEGNGREAKPIDFLDAASEEVGTAFPGLPEVEGAVRRALGTSYAGLALYERARRELETAYDMLREIDPEDPGTLATMASLARLYTAIDRGDEAIVLLEEVVAHHRAISGEDAEPTFAATASLVHAMWERGRRDEARALVAETVEPCRSALGEAHRIFLDFLSDQAAMVPGSEGIAIAEEALGLYREHLGPAAPGTLNVQHTLAVKLFGSGRREEAERLMREECEMKERLFGEVAPETLWSMGDLSDLYRMSGRLEDSLSLRLEQLHRIEIAGLARNRLHFFSLRKAALLLSNLHRLDEAAAYARRSVEGFADILPREHDDLLRARFDLATIEYQRGEYEESHELLEFIVGDCATVFPRGTLRTVLLTAGRCAERVGKLDTARAHLTRALELAEGLAEDHPIPVSIHRDLARIEQARGEEE